MYFGLGFLSKHFEGNSTSIRGYNVARVTYLLLLWPAKDDLSTSDSGMAGNPAISLQTHNSKYSKVHDYQSWENIGYGSLIHFLNSKTFSVESLPRI